MTDPTGHQEEKELRLRVLRYMECAVRGLECRPKGELAAEMRSIRAVTGLSHAELLTRGAEILLANPG